MSLESIPHLWTSFQLAKEEEKELLVRDGISKIINYPISKISDNTTPQCSSIYRSKTPNTMDCGPNIQRSRSHPICYPCEDNLKEYLNPIVTSREPSLYSKQNPNVHATFSTNVHIPLEWVVREKLRDYLLGSKCTIYTDNNPLAYIKESKLGVA